MENEPQKDQLTDKELENLDKILNKLLSVKEYIFFIIKFKFQL